MRKLVPLIVFAVATAALAVNGRIPGLRKPMACPALNSATVSIGFAGPLSGCANSNTKLCGAGEAIAFSIALPAANNACGTETVSWNFGDNTTATGTALTHTFTALGIYSVTATITNSRQTYSASIPISVSSPVPAPNRIMNGTFDHDISQWGFDFTLSGGQGVGDASWSNLDADGKPGSGSMHLRNTANGRAFQEIQCVALNPGEQYTFGGRAYYDGNTAGGAVFAVAEFASSDCSGGSPGVIALRTIQVAFPGAKKWVDTHAFANAESTAHSGYLFLAAGKSGPGTLYEVYFDNVFLRSAQ